MYHFNPILRGFLILFCLLFLNAPLAREAGDPDEEQVDKAEKTEQDEITLNLNNIDIRSFISSVSETTGKNFIVDPRVKGNVTVISATPVTADQLYAIFLSVLKVHGYSTVTSGDTIKILPNTEAREDNIGLVTGPQQDPGDRLVTRVIKIRHTTATEIIPAIRPLLPKHAHIAAHASSNTLVVADTAANLQRIVMIIDQIDRSSDSEMVLVRLQHTQGNKLLTHLTALGKATTKPSASSVPLALHDERTNTLILQGDDNWRSQAERLIKQLDQPVSNEDDTEVIYLKFADAKSLVSILRGIGEKRLQANVNEELSKTSTASEHFGIQADEAINALIVTAPPFLMQSLREVIDKLDIRRKQVHIEAIIAEIRNDKSVELGIEWQSSLTKTDGLIFSSRLPLTSSSSSSGGSFPGSIGSGFSLGYFKGGDLRVLIKAFAGNSDANILSTPSIVTLDNEEASIHIGQNVPFVTGQFTNSDSNAGQNPFQTIERHDVGIKLKVTPHINEGNTVKLKIEQEVSSVDSSSSVDGLVTNKRIINTTVLVDNEEVIVLGGLIQDTLNESQAKIPLLGDIPVIGQLFQSRRTTKDKNNLLVFIRPQIIDNRDHSREISMKRYTDIRSLQEEINKKGISLMPGEQSPLLPDPENKSITAGQPPADKQSTPEPPARSGNTFLDEFH